MTYRPGSTDTGPGEGASGRYTSSERRNVPRLRGRSEDARPRPRGRPRPKAKAKARPEETPEPRDSEASLARRTLVTAGEREKPTPDDPSPAHSEADDYMARERRAQRQRDAQRSRDRDRSRDRRRSDRATASDLPDRPDDAPPPGPDAPGRGVTIRPARVATAREDFWQLSGDGKYLHRNHVVPRRGSFSPLDAEPDIPVPVAQLRESRRTVLRDAESGRPFPYAKVENDWRQVWTEDKPWIGSTIFAIREDEPPATEKLDLRDAPKKVMTKGQRKHFDEGVRALAEEDVAMWSSLRGHRPSLPRGWKAILELFAGCAVLTTVFQADGYSCCSPLDLQTGWDVFDPAQRQLAEDIQHRDCPYVLSVAFPCSPWSPWQRLNADRSQVRQDRREWTRIFRWLATLIQKQKSRGGVTVLENPWTSDAWYTYEMANIIAENDLEVIRVDMCRFGLRGRESYLPHKKPTAIVTDSPGVAEELRGRTCLQNHEHQILEGSNCYGPRCRQAAKYRP